MTILTTHNLGKYFGDQDIFTHLSLALHHGDQIALVGPNGEGKTTLLKILARLEPASEGEVHTMKGLSIGYLEQHASLISTAGSLWELAMEAFADLRQQESKLRAMEARLAEAEDSPHYHSLLAQYGEAQAQFEHAGGYTYEQTIDLVFTGLGFTEIDYHKSLAQFSGGEQSRAHLARLLLEKPELLLLDEPTNHLDLFAVEWLESYLQSWPGAFVVVSHDRYFLDKVANQVWELSFGRVNTYRGNFSHYVQQREERFERYQKEYEAQQAFIEKEEDFIRRHLAGQRSKEAKGRRTRLARMKRLPPPRTPKQINLPLQTTLRSGDRVLETHNLVIGYPDHDPLFTCPSLEIRRGDRIALLGPNGAGKTTFIKTILGNLKPQAGAVRLGTGVKLGYFAQTHSSLNLSASILDEILTVKNLPLTEARNYLGRFLFSGDDVFKPIEVLSGGERSRVALAKLILTGANFLILDEPTNHLDIPSQETLEDVLTEFSGTILMVSHDRYFIEALATHIWALDPEAQSIMTLEGGYSEYLAYREAQATLEQEKATTTKTASQIQREKQKAEKRAAEQKAKQIAEIETMIAATEAKLAHLSQQLEEASYTQDVPKIEKLGQDYQMTAEKLETLLNQWVEMEAA